MRNSWVIIYFLTAELPSYFVAVRTFVALGCALFGLTISGRGFVRSVNVGSNSISYARLTMSCFRTAKRAVCVGGPEHFSRADRGD